MVEKAFISIDNYLNFFKEIEDIYEAKENIVNGAVSDIYTAFGHLLEDDEPKDTNQFLVPKIPKTKKEVKEKRESTRASRKNAVPALKSTVTISVENVEKSDDRNTFRRSTRIASKKVLPVVPVTSDDQSKVSVNDTTISFIQSIDQSKHTDDTKKKRDSVNTEEESIPCLAHSTPISSLDDTDYEHRTPHEGTTVRIDEKPASVKRRVQDFEKQTFKVVLPTKLPLRTPEKKNAQDEKASADNAPVGKSRFLRSNKVLQDKNMNTVEPALKQNVVKKVKKPASFKANLGINKNKIGTYKYKPASQRKIENKDLKASKKDLKTHMNHDSSESSQSGTPLLEVKSAEENKMKNKNDHSEDIQYELDHVLENESSEDEDCPKKQIPTWATKEMREHPLNVQAWIDKKETVYPWFSNQNLKNPKLEELFSVKIKMRPRTSSAVWNTKSNFK